MTNRRVFNLLCALDGDWLWEGGHTAPWGRTNLKTGERQRFLPLRDNANRFVVYFLQPLGHGQIVAGDEFGLWVLTLPTSKR